MSSRNKREGRVSTARRRAENHATTNSNTVLKLPEGMQFYELKKGKHYLEIIPYIVGKGNPYADKGELHYERTFFTYRNIGPEEKRYIAPSKTFHEPDYVQEERQRKAREEGVDKKALKALEPQERQIFLVWDRKDKEKGLQCWETSYHNFGVLLDERIKNSDERKGWDMFYYPDEDGRTLEITVSDASGGDFSYVKATAIDFEVRDTPIPEKIVNHGYCLDDFLVHLSYEELKNAFLGRGGPDDDDDGDDDDTPAPTSRKQADDDEDEEAELIAAAKRKKEREEEEADAEEKRIRAAARKAKEREEAEAASKAAEKATEKGDTKRPNTVEKMGLVKDMAVKFNGKKHTIIRIRDDGEFVTLEDAEGELVKAPADECTPWKEPAKAKASEKEAKADTKNGTKAKGGDDEEWDAGWKE